MHVYIQICMYVHSGCTIDYVQRPRQRSLNSVCVFCIYIVDDSPAAMQDSVMGASSGSGALDTAGGPPFAVSAAVPDPSGLCLACGNGWDHVLLLAFIGTASLLR